MTYMYMYKKVYKLCHGTIMCAIVEPVADICVYVSVDQALLTSTVDEGADGAEEVTREEQLQVLLSDVTVTTPPDYRTIFVICAHTRNIQSILIMYLCCAPTCALIHALVKVLCCCLAGGELSQEQEEAIKSHRQPLIGKTSPWSHVYIH